MNFSPKLNKNKKNQGFFSKMMNKFMKSPIFSIYNKNSISGKLSPNTNNIVEKHNMKNKTHTSNVSAKRPSRAINSRLYPTKTIDPNEHNHYFDQVGNKVSNKSSRQNSTKSIKFVKTRVNSITNSQGFYISIPRQS